MKLVVLDTTLAVCRLDPAERIPSWALEERHAFLSVTRTEQELSIVCPSETVSPEIEHVEDDWRALSVEGRLDFALTGVLASLAEPLARAEIPIFVVSTFDTDHVLVGEADLGRAIEALRAAGHEVAAGAAGRDDGPDGPAATGAGAARRRIASGSPYEPVIGFSRAVRDGDRVLVSGTGPVVPDGDGAGPADTLAQARRCWEIVLAALGEAGASAADVVRTRTFLTPAADADAAMAAHGEVFADVRPASTMLRIHSLLDPAWVVEVEAEAHLRR